MYQYEFKADYETRKIYFGEWEIPCKGYMKRLKDVIKVVKEMNGRLEGSEYDGTLYKNFNTTYGITPTHFKKVYNALYQKVNVEPMKKWALQYAFNSSGKLDVVRLDRLWQIKDSLFQMEADNTENLIPFLVYLNKTPSEMKAHVGKGVWKALCKNSKTRNKYIASLSQVRGSKESISTYNTIPSTVLKRGNNSNVTHYPNTVSVLCQHHKAKDVAKGTRDVVKDCRTISDTTRMARQLDKEVNDKWSLRKWHEKHEEWTREINARRYSPEPIKWLTELPSSLKTVEHKGLVARVLVSPLDIRTEGDVMRHCVGSYAGRVQSGDYIVYHIEDGGCGTTLGFTKSIYMRNLSLDETLRKTEWTVQQHYGKCNNHLDVTENHKELANHIAMMLNVNEQEELL